MISRRRVLVAGAVLPAIWIAPQILSVPIASATDLGSRPPASPPKRTVSQPQMGPALPKDLPAQLAYTGPNVERDAQLGAAALVAGAAVVGLAKQKRTTP